MSILIFLQLGTGLILLLVGAEGLVRGAARIAAALGISSLVIGLTVVAFGTSAPELAVSVQSALNGHADIAVGNVVGSNIFNVLFILGLSALITPLIVNQQLVRLDVPIMIGVSMLLWFFCLDGQIQRWEGIIFFVGIVSYTTFLIIQSRREKDQAVQEEYEQEYSHHDVVSAIDWMIQIGLVLGGLALLILGSRWLVTAATVIAQALGVSPLIIGLTLIAAGTSLPEVATSVVASLRDERDIAVGNVVGSNIFNILAVLGLSASLTPNGVAVSEAARNFDIVVMVAVAVACLPIFFTGYLIGRWKGFLFLGYYIAYTVYLFLASQHHDALPAYSEVMVLFVIPLTVLTLGAVTWRSWRAQRHVEHE